MKPNSVAPIDHAASNAPQVPVWDLAVRLFHWSLVASMAVLWFSAESARGLHETLGLAVLGLVLARLVWGRFGPHHARFGSFVRGPAAVRRYARAVWAHRAPRHVGHNPLGGWMVLGLLAVIGATGATGWLMGTDRFFGSEAVESLHEWLADALVGLVVLHLAGVVHAGWSQRENLVRAMFTGRKRAPQGDDVP